MGNYKIGSECCNNCIHWDAERDNKHGQNIVFSYKNLAKCTSLHSSYNGRNTLSSSVCPIFSHVWGITHTFSAPPPAPSPGEAFLQGIIEQLKSQAVVSKQIDREVVAEQEDDEDLNGDVEAEFARAMEDLGKANERAAELVREGMDPSYIFKDKAVEFMHLLDRAKSRSARAQFVLAQSFWSGTHGCKKENESSGYGNGWHWCNESADNGYCWAQLWKGVSWRNDAVKSDSLEGHEKAVKWLEKALQHSEIREKDSEKNGVYLRALNNSRITLGVKYLNGKDVVPDFDVAMSYFDAVADAGDSRGDEYKRKAEELCEKLRNAVDAWLCLSNNDDGDVEDSTVGHASNELGMIYAGYCDYVSYQLVIKKDVQKAVEYFEKAANLGHQDGMDNLGNCYLNGRGVEKDAKKAVVWYRKSAESGWPSGQYHYAVRLRKGDGVEKDETAALKWFMKAGTSGHAQSLNMLGWCAEGGRGMDEDPELAFEWYKLAAEAGDAESMYELGRLYKKGYGCKENETLGDEWQDKAKKNGYSGEW